MDKRIKAALKGEYFRDTDHFIDEAGRWWCFSKASNTFSMRDGAGPQFFTSPHSTRSLVGLLQLVKCLRRVPRDDDANLGFKFSDLIFDYVRQQVLG